MVYWRRRYKRQWNKKQLTKSNIFSKRKSRNQAKQIYALSRRLRSVETKAKRSRQWCQFKLNVGNYVLTNDEWKVVPLVHPSNWVSQFQANSSVNQGNKVVLKSMYAEFYFSPENSLVPLTPKIITFYIVKLRDETGVQTLNDTSQMSDTGFNDNDMNGKYWNAENIGMSYPTLTMLNRGAFRIVFVKRFQIQNIIQETAAMPPPATIESDVPLTTPRNTYRRFTCKLKLGNLLKSADNINWSQMGVNEVAIKDRLYILCHVGGNGSLVTTEAGNSVEMGLNVNFTCRGTN